MNSVQLTGYLGADPVKKQFEKSNNALFEFSLAVTSWRKNAEVTYWIDCERWGTEFKFKKGDAVEITGTLEIESWEKDGQKHRKPLINVVSCRYAPQRKQGGEQQQPAQQQSKAPF